MSGKFLIPSWPLPWPAHGHSLVVYPERHLVGIEAHVLADLEERDASFGDQATDKDDLHAQPEGQCINSDEFGA